MFILTLLGSGHQKPARNLPVPGWLFKKQDVQAVFCPRNYCALQTIDFYTYVY